jgi:hypothetical protein
VGNIPERNLAVEVVERLVEGDIRAPFYSDLVQ